MPIETTSQKIIIHQDELVTEMDELQKSGACPDGMKRGEHGICEEIQIHDTTEINIELTTDPHENVGGIENIKGCPPGTEADEQGSCQEIKPTNSTTKITNPKALLNDDGSCPDNYKMIEGRCLFIKSKTNSTLIPSQMQNDLESKSKLELVPVLSDNSCPEGTEYSEYGLCQKRLHPPTFNRQTKFDSSTTQVQLELITKTSHVIKDKIRSEEFSSTSESTPL
jgi:hypothetical protein